MHAMLPADVKIRTLGNRQYQRSWVLLHNGHLADIRILLNKFLVSMIWHAINEWHTLIWSGYATHS